MRIAFIVDGLYPDTIGGIQKYSFELIRALADLGHEVVVYVQYPCPLATDELRSKKNISIQLVRAEKTIKLPGKYLRQNNLFSKAVFRQIMKESGIDVIYAQGFTGIYGVSPAFRGACKIPLFVNLHGLEMFQPAKGIKSLLIQWYFRFYITGFLRQAKYAIALGKELEKIMHRVQPDLKTWVIPNGIEESWFDIKPDNNENKKERKFLFVGRYEWRKGLDTLNKILPAMVAERQDWSMEFVGDIPLHKRVKAENIVYHGAIRDTKKMKEIYAGSDVLICPSYSEGMPTVVLEAMAAGKAVIATNVGATSELVSDSNGFLIPPFDDTRLKFAIERCLAMDIKELRKLQEESRKAALEKFNWKGIADLHLAAFSQAI